MPPLIVRPPALALLNPRADGGRAAALIEPLRAALGPVPLTLCEDLAATQACLRALPPQQRVLIAGGDGSVQALLGTLQECNHELALLPLGSGNDLARALGLLYGSWHSSWRARLQRLLSTPATRMDLGELEVGGVRHCFASSLGVGFDAAVGQRVHHSKLRVRGLTRYLHATLAELHGMKPYAMQIACDGQPPRRGRFLLASCLNTATYGAGMRAAPGARIDDGRLTLLSVQGYGRLGAALALPLMLAGWHRRLPGVELLDFEQAHYRAPTPVPLLLDGEAVPAASEFSVRVLPQALAVVRGS